MIRTQILWLALGLILGITSLLTIQNFIRKPSDEPLKIGVISYNYQWLPGDSSQAQVKVEVSGEIGNSGQGQAQPLREYEITAHNEAFTVKLSVLGREVDSARILEARFHGQTQVTVYRDRIVTIPQTPGLAVKYKPEVLTAARREKWVEAQVLIGVLLVPPHSPIIAGGVGLRRLPLVGKLPPVTLGVGWFGTAPGAFVEYRF